jgi:hypothetical protein
MLSIPEKFLRSDAEIELFELGGKKITVRLLGSNRAEAWSETARRVSELDAMLEYQSLLFERARKERDDAKEDNRAAAESAVGKALDRVRGVQRERWHAIVKALEDYGAPFTKDVIETATSAQLVAAFHLLNGWNDPFVVMGSVQMAWLMEMKAAADSSPGTKH